MQRFERLCLDDAAAGTPHFATIAMTVTDTTMLSGQLRLAIAEVDAPRPDWDGFLAATGGDIVQSAIWGLSKRAIGQPALLIEARNAGGQLVGGALMIERRIGPGISLGYVARGPVATADDPAVLPALLDALAGVARSRRHAALIVQPPAGGEGDDALWRSAGYIASPMAVAPEATIRIDLTQSDEAILAAMSTSRRRNVRHSWREAIEIVHSDEVAMFHQLHSATGTRKTFSALSLDYLTAQWQALAPSGAVTIMFAQEGGTPVAGLWLSRFGGVVTLRLSGWNAAAARAKNVNEGIRWAAFQWARSAGATTFDFGAFDRSAAEHVLAGEPLPAQIKDTHTSFKLGFNPVPVLLPRAKLRVSNPAAAAVVRWAGPAVLGSKLARRIAQRMRSG